MSRSTAGTGTLVRFWNDAAEEYFPGDVNTLMSTVEGGGGRIMLNQLSRADPDGSTYAALRAINLAIFAISDDIDLNIGAYRHPHRYYADTRGIQINPRTTDISSGPDGHFQWSWDDFVAACEDQTLRFGVPNPSHRLCAEMLKLWEPRLNDDNLKVVITPGGSETRAAMLRGDIDGYFGSMPRNFGIRNEYYKSQFMFANPEKYPDFTAMAQEVTSEEDENVTIPDSALWTNTTFPEAEKFVDVILDAFVSILPPNTPDQIYDTFVETFQTTAAESDLEETILDEMSAGDWSPSYGPSVQDFLDTKRELFVNDEEINALLQDFY